MVIYYMLHKKSLPEFPRLWVCRYHHDQWKAFVGFLVLMCQEGGEIYRADESLAGFQYSTEIRNHQKPIDQEFIVSIIVVPDSRAVVMVWRAL